MRIRDPHRIGTLFLIALMVVGLSTCKKKLATPEYDSPYDETSETYIPTPDLNTTVVTDIKALTATSGGQFQNDYGKPVTAKGGCWSLAPNPTIEASCSSDGSATTNFASNLTGLRPDTVYYVRAYATNEAGTIYGGQRSFRTKDGVATFSGLAITNLTSSGAAVAVTVDQDGGDAITARGVCYSKEPDPTTAGTCIASGTGTGAVAVAITELDRATAYYVRPYATNAVMTSYGAQVTFRTLDTLTDIDGNVYPIVQIGTQVWMAANLRTTRYRNNSNIDNVTNATTWSGLTTGAWAHYDNNSANETVYGKLYNWHAVADSRNICPTGWHVPSDAEWTILSNFLATDVGFKMKATSGWGTGNGSDASGFNGLPGGSRDTDGAFGNVGSHGNFWSSSEVSSDKAWNRDLLRANRALDRGNNFKRYGLSVRCLRD